MPDIDLELEDIPVVIDGATHFATCAVVISYTTTGHGRRVKPLEWEPAQQAVEVRLINEDGDHVEDRTVHISPARCALGRLIVDAIWHDEDRVWRACESDIADAYADYCETYGR